MNDILDIEIILKRKKYPKVYNIVYIIIIISLLLLYISITYKYQTYYISKGKMTNNKLELLVNIEDLDYINNNNTININNIKYVYSIDNISKELYADEYLNNYKYVYLKIDDLNSIENYVYEVKIEKENKALIKYLKNYF